MKPATLLALMLAVTPSYADDPEIQSFDSSGTVIFNEIPGATAYRIEWSSALPGTWDTFSNAAASLDHIPTLGGGAITSRVPMAYRVLAATNWPAPAGECAFYTEALDQPQTQSATNLAKFLSSEHFNYTLDGWFFMGNLVEDGKEDDPGVFFINAQRIEQDLSPQTGWGQAPMVFAAVGFDSSTSGDYMFGGTAALDTWPLVIVTSMPWKVEINPIMISPLITMELVSGTMGVSGAVYRLTSELTDLGDTNGTAFRTDVWLCDRLGAVNQGYGTASFYPQFLKKEQQTRILQQFGGSVQSYLENTGDPMSCQGSLYYSLPLFDVTSFSITKDGSTVSTGNAGSIWMDYIVQGYDQQWAGILSSASWTFMAVRFPDTSMAMTIFQMTNDLTGVLPVAKLFGADSDRTTNGARNAIHQWDIDEIDIGINTNSIWQSPKTGEKYALEHRVQLGGSYPADLTITMVRTNQEIVITNKEGNPPTVKYEGEAMVTGTVNAATVSGWAFMELQPLGHL